MSKVSENICSLKELPKFALDVLKSLGDSGIVLLRGNLASGKTSFVQAFAHALGVNDVITSPTFSILHEYDKGIFHYDIYQCGSEGFLKNGLLEKLDEKGYHLIEWGDETFEKMLQRFKIPYTTIDITIENSKRLYKVQTHAHA